MIKYATVIDETTKRCNVGVGKNFAFYERIGMKPVDVERAYDGQWYLKGYAPEKPFEQKAAEARAERDRRIDSVRWRIERYQTQKDAGLETTDNAEYYKSLLLYIQALRDVPKQDGFPEVVEWPEEPRLVQ